MKAKAIKEEEDQAIGPVNPAAMSINNKAAHNL